MVNLKKLVFSFPLLYLLSVAVVAQSTIFPVSLKTRKTAVNKLADVIQFQTVSSLNQEQFRYKEFKALHAYLQDAFPLIEENLTRNVVNQYSLLYTWKGSNSDLKPVLLSAHMDVVPVEAASEGGWQEEPFAGVVKEGFIWGRGTMDDKYRVMAIMEAVENLLEKGYQLERTVYLAFGHDEEVGGYEGAGKISAYLAEQGVELEAVFDEGLAIAEDVLPSISEPLALVGTAAKGNINLKLTVEGTGGHSSVPPKDSPIYILGNAISNLHAKPFKARMTPTTKETVAVLANNLGGKYQFAMRHYYLFKGKILKMLAKDRATDALIRTKMVPTILEAGDKYNVLPRIATAVINVRILNGETDETVLRHIQKAIDDDRVKIEVHGVYTPPSPVTATNTQVFESLRKAIVDNFENVLVVPALFPGSTDSKHYTNLTDNIFRFAPQVVNRKNAQLIHNVDERLAIDVYERSITFYDSLIRNTCGKNAEMNMVSDDDLNESVGVLGN
ncbi:M20/M25/M40 family metallo-hydrolase [Pontibacter locisalis]|uniref:M20/M25/M40 family metallo-hydrolase n=1 Tax=Pontibacter locisalis TaxID=1719035 RepID=A0ABW5IR42_9BACT